VLCICLKETNPYFCLAAEEYLLKNFREDIFMLWQSVDAVVVGKHQNALAELNYPCIREKGICVARRISGGGTVFHDKGNINFSWIKSVNTPQEINFSAFTESLAKALMKLGIATETSSRGDLFVEGKKISGNAEHIFKNRVLHHGTLLFNSDLPLLKNALRPTPGKYLGKAVQSVRSQVTNISDFLPVKISVTEFKQHLVDDHLTRFPSGRMAVFSGDQTEQIMELARTKYETRDWIFGYSPGYSFSNTLALNGKKIELHLEAEKGIVTSAGISGDFYPEETARLLENLIPGNFHQYESIERVHHLLNFPVTPALIYSYF